MTSTPHFNCPTCDRIIASLEGSRLGQKSIRAKIRRLYTTDAGRALTQDERIARLTLLEDTLWDLKSTSDTDRERLKTHLDPA